MTLVFYNQILNVDISTYVNAAIFRHLTMFQHYKCNVCMLPVHETNDLSREVNLNELDSLDFSIELQKNVFELRLMVGKNSKCKSLLTSEFANNIIWALDEEQDYKEIRSVISLDSYNYVYQVVINDEKHSEIIYLNVHRAN